MALDYKNADKKMLKENLKNTIQGLLREGTNAYVAPQAGVSELTPQDSQTIQNIDTINTANYPDAITILKKVIAESNGKNNMAFRKALLKEFTELGGNKISVKQATPSVSQLIPTQREISADGSLGFILYKNPGLMSENIERAFAGGPVKIAGNPIITCGNYIVDGHHRWSQVYLLNPNATMAAIDIGGGFSDETQILKLVQIAIANSQLAAGSAQSFPASEMEGDSPLNLLGQGQSAKAKMVDYIKKAPSANQFYELMGPKISGQGQNLMEEAPVQQAPAQQGPVQQAPVQQTPAQQAPVQQGQTQQSQYESTVLEYCGNNAAALGNIPNAGKPPRNLMPQTDKAPGGIEGSEKSLASLSTGNIGGEQNVNSLNTSYSSNISSQANKGPENATPQNVPNQGQNVQQPKDVPQNMKNNQVQENKKNMKLTEAQLKQVIQESVKRVLREMDEINKEYEDMKKAQAYDKYLGQNMLKRGLDIVTGKRPEKPYPYTPNEPMGTRAQRYVDAFNKEHSLGNRVDYPGGESYHSAMAWSNDPENRYEPVLKQTAYDGSTVAQQRKAFQDNGDYKEWGVEYPYSEFGYTGKYEGDNEDIKKRSAQFDKLRDKVSGDLAKSKRDRESKKKNESVVRLSASEFSKFLEESVKNVIKEMHDDYDSFNAGMDGNFTDRISRRYAEKAKYGYGNLDEGPWEDDGEFEQARANVRKGGRMEEEDWGDIYNPGGMGPAYQKYGIPDDVLYGDR